MLSNGSIRTTSKLYVAPVASCPPAVDRPRKALFLTALLFQAANKPMKCSGKALKCKPRRTTAAAYVARRYRSTRIDINAIKFNFSSGQEL